MKPILVVENLKKSYKDVKAVNELSFSIEEGEVFGLLGHNGAGKSTTIECVLGTKYQDSGKIRLLGVDPRKDRKNLFEQIGVQFQHTNYQATILVKEICEVTAALYKTPQNWSKLLEEFNLGGKENQKVANLSGGERQKLSVLLALIPSPKMVFLDELTTGLDSRARRNIWKYLLKQKEKGLTIFLTSHYMDEIEVLCNRICILNKGEVVVMDTVENVVDNSPYDNLEEAYLWYTGGEEDEGI